jgi:hypothetical protein
MKNVTTAVAWMVTAVQRTVRRKPAGDLHPGAHEQEDDGPMVNREFKYHNPSDFQVMVLGQKKPPQLEIT